MIDRGAQLDSFVYDKMLPRDRWGLAAAIGLGTVACVLVVKYPPLDAALLWAILSGAVSACCTGWLLRIVPFETTVHVFEQGLEGPTLWGKAKYIRWDQIHKIAPYAVEPGASGIAVSSADRTTIYIPILPERLKDFRAFVEARVHARHLHSSSA